MELEDFEQLLENTKFEHLSEATLISYNDSQLDKIRLALADAHLKLCLICDRRLTFLKEEAEALESYVVTEEDRASIQQLIRKPRTKLATVSTELERLNSYIKDLLTAWIIPFSKQAMRGTGDGDEVWRYQSEDGLLTAWAILEKDVSLTVHFSSPELAWEGSRLRFRLGRFKKEVTLQGEGDSRVAARVKIPRAERTKKMADISIEVISA
ncbi:MAG TPA: hypothetical protein DC047_09910 [Blastocatellia bacterium]|nr:hypothetical protein [Blastocatellia bacterium]